jgi:hypothetical protein
MRPDDVGSSAPAGADEAGPAGGPPAWPGQRPGIWRAYRRGPDGPGRRTVSVRLAPDEVAELAAAADRARLRLSGYIAEAALAAARNTRPPLHDPVRDALAELIRASNQLRRVAGNLNQAVKALNATGTAPVWLADALRITMQSVGNVDAAADAMARQLPGGIRRRGRRAAPAAANDGTERR